MLHNEGHTSNSTYWRSGLGLDLFYSYRACGGDPMAYIDAVATANLIGKTIRAAIPKFSNPDHFRIDSATGVVTTEGFQRGLMTSDLEGVWIKYWKELARRGEFQIEWHSVSQGSINAYSSAWTACVQDVQNGLLDVRTFFDTSRALMQCS